MNENVKEFQSGRSSLQKIRLLLNFAATRAATWFGTARARAAFWAWGVDVGAGLRVCGPVRIRNAGQLVLGKNVRLNSRSRLNYVGGEHRVAMWISKDGKLEIGDNVGMSNCTIVCTHRIVIENNVMIGGGTSIYDTDFHPVDPVLRQSNSECECRPVVLKDNVFIGSYVIILKGVTIGKNSVVGAGSVVTKDVPQNQIWAGNPARLIRHVDH